MCGTIIIAQHPPSSWSRKRRVHTQVGNEVMKGICTKRFRKNIKKLIRRPNEVINNLFADKATIKFNVFNTLIYNLVVVSLMSSLVVTMNGDRLSRGKAKVKEEILDPLYIISESSKGAVFGCCGRVRKQ